MKKTAYGKVIMVWLAWVIFCAAAQHQGLAVQAQESGSIELQLPAQAAGAELTLWRVAQARNGAFFYEDAFAESGIAIVDLSDTTAAQEAAEALASYAKEQKLAGTKGTAAADGKVLFDGLTPALYLAAQSAGQEKLQVSAALVPIPYHSAGTGTEAYHAQLAPKYSVPGGAAILHKVGTHKEYLSGAQFTLQQKVYLQAGEQAPQGAESGSDAQGSFYWKELQSRLTTNAHGQLAVKNLPQAAYRFVETKAPDTYLLDSAPHEFVISEPGQLQEIDGVFSAAGGKTEELTVVNYPDPTNGYYYEGTLTVTKKVVQGGEPMESDETYYAAAFEDAAHTKPFGQILVFDMAGNSEVSCELPLYVGVGEDEQVTYYIAETDVNGVPLDTSGAALDFEISIDREQVTVSQKHSKESVTITNTFREEGGGTPSGGGSSSGGGKGGSNVQTGDDTPLGAYLAAMLLAFALLAAAASHRIFRRLRR